MIKARLCLKWLIAVAVEASVGRREPLGRLLAVRMQLSCPVLHVCDRRIRVLRDYSDCIILLWVTVPLCHHSEVEVGPLRPFLN